MTDRNIIEYELTVGERSWRLRMGDILVDEWCELEELSGMDAGELYARFLQGGMRARKAFVYLARKRGGDGVPWDSPELNFRIGDFYMRDTTPKPRKNAKGGKAATGGEGSPDPTQETGSPSPTS